MYILLPSIIPKPSLVVRAEHEWGDSVQPCNVINPGLMLLFALHPSHPLLGHFGLTRHRSLSSGSETRWSGCGSRPSQGNVRHATEETANGVMLCCTPAKVVGGGVGAAPHGTCLDLTLGYYKSTESRPSALLRATHKLTALHMTKVRETPHGVARLRVHCILMPRRTTVHLRCEICQHSPLHRVTGEGLVYTPVFSCAGKSCSQGHIYDTLRVPVAAGRVQLRDGLCFVDNMQLGLMSQTRRIWLRSPTPLSAKIQSPLSLFTVPMVGTTYVT